MELTFEQKRRIERIMWEKLGQSNCPMCHSANVQVTNQLFQLPAWEVKDGEVLYQSINFIPTALVICRNCNYIMPFSLL